MISKEGLTHHISAQFNAELEEVRSHLLAMGGLVEKQVNDAVTALIEADVAFHRAIYEASGNPLRRIEWFLQSAGDPNDREATKYIIDRARADGITVVGLGIGVDTSPVFDSRYAATITDIGELSASMVKLVKAAFEDNRRVH